MCLGDGSFVGNAVGKVEEEGEMAYEANAVAAKFGELREEMARRVAALRPMIMFVSASGEGRGIYAMVTMDALLRGVEARPRKEDLLPNEIRS